jgi:hypothetical protein
MQNHRNFGVIPTCRDGNDEGGDGNNKSGASPDPTILQINCENALENFMNELNDLSVPTRYPDELRKLLKQFTRKLTFDILM